MVMRPSNGQALQRIPIVMASSGAILCVQNSIFRDRAKRAREGRPGRPRGLTECVAADL